VLAREHSLRTSYQRSRQLAGRLINAQEVARAELARELHDGVCQELVAVSLSVNSLKSSSGDIQDAQTQQALSKLHDETINTFEGVRRLSHDLHPASLQLLGLPAALRAHCSEVAKRYRVEVAFKMMGDLGDVHPDIAVSMFRIAQESLRNGIVHGEAQRLALSLARSGNHIELTIFDDGRGFDLEAARRDGGGLGLVSMEERAHAVGGDVQIVTEPHKGTTIRVRCPAGAGAARRDVLVAGRHS
jgi:two-component system sensor histidine kinase UhpB